MADEIDGMAFFVAVAEARGFRAAGARLGVSGSAVSQALRRLEERLGVALVQRTTRSVHLTEAGQQLYVAVRPALNELRAAVAAVGELAEKPRGTRRLLVSTAADNFLAGPLLADFQARQPHVRVDVIVSDARAALVSVLAEFGTPFPGYYLNYPERRQVSLPLRSLIEHVRTNPAAPVTLRRRSVSRGQRS